MKYHAAPNTPEASTDTRAAYLNDEVFDSAEICQAEINRLGLADLYHVAEHALEAETPNF